MGRADNLKKWPKDKKTYQSPPMSTPLGVNIFVKVESNITVVNMIAQHSMGFSHGKLPIRHDALEKRLAEVAPKAKGWSATVHMPRIGCGLAGGKWDMVEPIIRRTLCDAGINTFIYNLQSPNNHLA